jgi:hypothetical protein
MKRKEVDALHAFIAMASQTNFESYFGGMPFSETEERSPYDNLGNGFELRPIEILAEDGQSIVDNRESFSHLYKDGNKVCDMVFRKGGYSGDFKDGYASLILYVQKEKHTEKRHGFDFGTHVIINEQGKTCLEPGRSTSYPSHQGGNIGKLKDTYYDLRTGEKILNCSSSGSISGQNFIIVEHKYDWYDKNLPLGVYKIDKQTCEFEKIDDIKR